METKVFTEIEEVNRLHVSHYRLDIPEGFLPSPQRITDQILFIGDRGNPEDYRAELVFKNVFYLDCPFQLFSEVHWRLASPKEEQLVFPPEAIFSLDIKAARRRSKVYCLEVQTAASDQKGSSARNRKEDARAHLDQLDLRTFFVVADDVEIMIQYTGDDPETYVAHLQQQALQDPMEEGKNNGE